jgi:predicted ATPase
MKGEILLTRRDNAEQAERCLHDALSTARAHHCRGFELRAATSLARLWHQRGKRADARQLLDPVYRSFSEGFGTADLKDAAKLLGEIP